MRLPRLKFTVPLMMVLVALAGAVFGSVEFHRRRVQFLDEADMYRGVESDFMRSAYDESNECGLARLGLSGSELVEYYEREKAHKAEWRVKALGYAAHYRSLRLKYEHAARYPWLPVARDPPAPE